MSAVKDAWTLKDTKHPSSTLIRDHSNPATNAPLPSPAPSLLPLTHTTSSHS